MSFPFHIICIRAPLSQFKYTFIEKINWFWVELYVCCCCSRWYCLFLKTKQITDTDAEWGRGSQSGSWNVWNANSKKHLNRLTKAKNQTPAMKDSNNNNKRAFSEREAKNNRQTETIGGKKLSRSLENEMKRLILLFEHKMPIVSFALSPRTKNSVDSFLPYHLVVYRIYGYFPYSCKDRQEKWWGERASLFFTMNILNIVYKHPKKRKEKKKKKQKRSDLLCHVYVKRII